MPNKADVSKTLEDLSPYEFFEWASYVENRTNGTGWASGRDFKRHKTLGQAKAAVTSGSKMIYWFQDGKVVNQRPNETHIYKWDFVKTEWQEVENV